VQGAKDLSRMRQTQAQDKKTLRSRYGMNVFLRKAEI
jgi:hypothetical protein